MTFLFFLTSFLFHPMTLVFHERHRLKIPSAFLFQRRAFVSRRSAFLFSPGHVLSSHRAVFFFRIAFSSCLRAWESKKWTFFRSPVHVFKTRCAFLFSPMIAGYSKRPVVEIRWSFFSDRRSPPPKRGPDASTSGSGPREGPGSLSSPALVKTKKSGSAVRIFSISSAISSPG